MNDIRKKRIVEAYKAGVLVADILYGYAVSVPALYRLLEAAGVPQRHKGRKKGPPRAPKCAEIVKRYSRGDVTMRDLAVQYGVTRQRVHQIIRRAQ